MKTLVVCYSMFGKTRKIASCLASSIGADFAEMKEISGHPSMLTLINGVSKARAGKPADILPVAADIAEYDCIVVAGPVWGGYPAPALYDFIREYDITGKQTYGLLSFSKDGKNAAKVLRSELERANTKCCSIITVKSKKATIQALQAHEMEFVLNSSNRLTLQHGNNTQPVEE